MITLLIIFLCVTVQTPFRMAISTRLNIELCLVQAEKSSSQSRLVRDLFRSFSIAFSEANLTQISALANVGFGQVEIAFLLPVFTFFYSKESII